MEHNYNILREPTRHLPSIILLLLMVVGLSELSCSIAAKPVNQLFRASYDASWTTEQRKRGSFKDSLIKGEPTPGETKDAPMINVYGSKTTRKLLQGDRCPDVLATLDAHNKYRAIHGSNELTWDEGLSASAARWAQNLADRCV